MPEAFITRPEFNPGEHISTYVYTMGHTLSEEKFHYHCETGCGNMTGPIDEGEYFEYGIQIPEWTIVDPDVQIQDGGATVFHPTGAGASNEGLAFTTAAFPVDNDGNPYSFEIRFHIRLGDNLGGAEIYVTDTVGFCPANLAFHYFGNNNPIASTPNNVDWWTDAADWCGPGSGSTAGVNWYTLPSGTTTGDDIVIGWDRATMTGYLDYRGTRYENSGSPNWAVADPGDIFYPELGEEVGKFRLLSLGNDFSGFSGVPDDPTTVILEDIEIEIMEPIV